MLCHYALILLTVFTLHSSATVSYGPSIKDIVTPEISQQGIQTEWNTISLAESAPSYSLVVPLLNGIISLNKSQVLKDFPTFHHGTFYVEAPQNFSVVAIVQVLRLQQVFGAPGKCLNYIQFSDMENQVEATEPICGIVEGQDLDLQPSSLIGPRTFVATSGKLAVKFFLFSNIISQEADMDPSRGAITVELSFTASPNFLPLNILGILYSSHMGLCQFLNYVGFQNDTWIYCPNPDLPDCVHQSLYCEKQMHCASEATAADYGMDQIKCDEPIFSNYTDGQQILWRLSELEIKVQKTPLRIEATRWVVIFMCAILGGLFVAIFVWQLISRCWRSSPQTSSKSVEQKKHDEEKHGEEEDLEAEASARRRQQQRLQSAVFIAHQLLQQQENMTAGGRQVNSTSNNNNSNKTGVSWDLKEQKL